MCVRALNLIAFSCVFLHFYCAIIGLVLIDMCVSTGSCRDDLVKLCTCIYCSFDVELIEFLLRRVFRFAVRACVSVSVIELTCDVTIAARGPRRRSVGRLRVSATPIHSFSQSVLV